MPFDFTDQQAQHIARQQVRSTERLTEKMSAALLLLLGEMIEEVTYRIKIGQFPIPLGAQQKWTKKLHAAELPLGRASAILGYNFASDLMTQLGRPTPGITDEGIEAGFLYTSIDEYFESASKRQANTFTRKVESSLKKSTEILEQSEGIELSAEALANAVMLDMEKFKATYATMAAVTAVAWSNNEGSARAYIKAGVVKWKWTTRGDSKVCPFCAELEGEVVAVSQYFARANERMPAKRTNADGDEVEVYLQVPDWNILHPPLHARCRCVLIPYE